MDLSQALLCLITFTAPAPTDAQKPGLATCLASEQAAEAQKKVDLDVHLRSVENDGSPVTSIAGMNFLEGH